MGEIRLATGCLELRRLAVGKVRDAIRSGQYQGHTAGLANGYLQTSLVILERKFALDFMRFCRRNPKSCPLVCVSDDGDPMTRTLGRDIDIRTDAPSYNIYRDGALQCQQQSTGDIWREDLIAFALGCSFTFEHALERHGIEVRNIREKSTVPMYRSTLPTVQAGSFRGPMVVSMRPIPKDRIGEAKRISHQYPRAHGAPVHEGDPQAIGITDITRPDRGEASGIRQGE